MTQIEFDTWAEKYEKVDTPNSTETGETEFKSFSAIFSNAFPTSLLYKFNASATHYFHLIMSLFCTDLTLIISDRLFYRIIGIEWIEIFLDAAHKYVLKIRDN